MDHEGRALVIVAVRNHLSARRDLRQMRLFSAYILDALVAACDPERNPQRRVVAMFDMTGAGRVGGGGGAGEGGVRGGAARGGGPGAWLRGEGGETRGAA